MFHLSRIRPDTQAPNRFAIFLIFFLAALWPLLWHATANGERLEVSDQEVRDIVQRGIEHNRTPNDIQEDLDGLNQARGGTGTVPLPSPIESVETPSGRVTMTGSEARTYRRSHQRTAGLRFMGEAEKEALKALEPEARRWTTIEQFPLVRVLAAQQEMAEAYADFQADLVVIKAKVLLVNRKPTPSNFGWAYRENETFEEAMRDWKYRENKLEALREEQYLVQSEYVSKIQKMGETDPSDTAGTSALNRSGAMLDAIGRQQDKHTTEIKWISEELRREEKRRANLERRARGDGGGPPVMLPPPDTSKTKPVQPPPKRADGDRDSTGQGDGDSTGTGGKRTDKGTGEDDDDDDLSLDDLLREFGDDEEADTTDRGRTVPVNEELLAGVQAEFDAAADDFERCYLDFIAKLRSMAGLPDDEICGNAELAASFSCAEQAYSACVNGYHRAHDMFRNVAPEFRSSEMTMQSEVDESSRVNPMDQITIILINTKYNRMASQVQEMRGDLAAAAPGCDTDDLLDSEDEPADWADDRSDDNRGGDRGGDRDRPDDDGDTTEPGELRFVAMGDAKRPNNDTRASCAGGQMTVEIGNVTLPPEVRPTDNITITVPLTWNVSGTKVKDYDVVIAVTFLGQNMVEERVSSASGSRSFRFSFSGREADFTQMAQAIMIIVGGGIMCENNMSDAVGIQIHQVYTREGQ